MTTQDAESLYRHDRIEISGHQRIVVGNIDDTIILKPINARNGLDWFCIPKELLNYYTIVKPRTKRFNCEGCFREYLSRFHPCQCGCPGPHKPQYK